MLRPAIWLILFFPLSLAAQTSRDSIVAFNSESIKHLYTDPGVALENSLKAIELSTRSGEDSLLVDSYRGAGNAYFIYGQFDKALEYYLKALHLSEKYGWKKQNAANLGNIGGVYYMTNQLDKSLEYYHKSLEESKAVGSNSQISSSYSNIGLVFEMKGRFQESLVYYLKALEIIKDLGKENADGGIYLNIGNIYKELGNRTKALEYYRRSLDIHFANGNTYGLGDTYSGLANFYRQSHPDSSALYARKAEEIGRELNSFFLQQRAHHALYEYYSGKGDYEKALQHYILHQKASDTIATQEVMEQEAKYRFEKKSREVELEQARKEEVQKAELVREKTIRNFSLGGSLILFGFLATVLYSYRRNKKLNSLLTAKNMVIQEKNKEITDSIQYAKGLQDAILPTAASRRDVWPGSVVFYRPKDIVAGDFFWFEKNGKRACIAAADCTGHGVPGAMLSVVCSNALNRALYEFGLDKPGEILDKVSTLVEETFYRGSGEVRDGMDISLLCIDPEKMEYEWAGANNPLWIERKGEWIIHAADRQPIGRFETRKPFSTVKGKLESNDQIWLFTDGFADQFGGEKGKKLKSAPFRKILSGLGNFDPEKQEAMLSDGFVQWKRSFPQVDDVCVIGLKV